MARGANSIMGANINLIRGINTDGLVSSNEDAFENDLTIDAGYSAMIAGPVVVPNVTVNGNLNVLTEINVTGNIVIGANGNLNVVG